MKYFHLFVSLLFMCAFLTGFPAFSQKTKEKREQEISIKKNEFPENALQLASPILKKAKKTKFYKESSESGDFYEFKSDYKGEKISVKFNTLGELVDIEILREFRELPEVIQKTITHYFEETYEKYRLTRIQVQYNREQEYEDGELEIDDDEEYLEEFLEMDLEDLIIKYEIEAEIKTKDKNTGFFEYLFSDKGDLEMKRIIIPRADDNVLY